MRALGTATLTQRYAEQTRPVWLLEISGAGWQWRVASRSFALDGIDFMPLLAEVKAWEESVGPGYAPGGRIGAKATVRLIEAPGSAEGTSEGLGGKLEYAVPLGLGVKLRLGWPNATSEGRVSEFCPALEGRVAAWRLDATGIELDLIDELTARGQRRPGRMLRPEMIGGVVSSSYGDILPWVFGRHERVRLLPLASGLTSSLASVLAEDATAVPLDSIEFFPANGTVQINDELIEYTALDSVNKTLGTDAQPVNRPAPQSHRKGATVRLVPNEGFSWLLADHPCEGVYAVYGETLGLVSTYWTSQLEWLGERQAQVIHIPFWPLDKDGNAASQVYAYAHGMTDEWGTLLENPVDVIEFLLTDARGMGLDAEQLDAASFAERKSELAALDYRFARRWAGDETVDELLEQALQEAGLCLGATAPYMLHRVEPSPHEDDVQESLDESKALDPRATVAFIESSGAQPADALELVGTARPDGSGAPSYQFPPETRSAGVLPRRIRMHWLDLASPNAAADMGELLWSHIDYTYFDYTQHYPLGAFALQAGEVARLDDAARRLIATSAWVRRMKLSGPARIELELRGPVAGAYCWQADDRNYIRMFGFGSQMVIVLDGRPVARLGTQGTLRLRGRVREQASIASGIFTGPLAVDDGKLYFNQFSGGNYVPFAELSSNGDLKLTGNIRERSSWSGGGVTSCHGSDGERFWLAPDKTTPALVWQASEAVLHLRVIVIESIRL